MSLAKRLQKARLTLLLEFPFFGSLALRLRPLIEAGVGTAVTNGRWIKFDPEFCRSLTDAELVYLYAHEVGHPALLHIFRLKGRDPERWNQAADYKVNQMLESVIKSSSAAALRMKRIDGALLDEQYDKLSAEEVYALLPSDGSASQPASAKVIGTFIQPSGQGEGEGADDDSDGSDGEGGGESSQQLEQEWKGAVSQSATVERMRNAGKLPAGLEKLVTELLEPAVPWQDHLRQFASVITRDDYSWSRANRRHVSRGFILPTLRSESLGTIVVALDTSGSIYGSTELLQAFLSELQGILDTCNPAAMIVIDCDAQVQAVTRYHPGDDMTLHTLKGGGGTRFEPVFDYCLAEDIVPDALLYFTDLYGSFPTEEPPYPTLWMNYDDPRMSAPFGENIHVSSSLT